MAKWVGGGREGLEMEVCGWREDKVGIIIAILSDACLLS